MKKRKQLWPVYFIFFVALIGFVVIPFCGDVQVFLGSSRLADYYDKGLIYNSFNVWEIKGVLLRLFFYVGYSLTRQFAHCPSMAFSIILSSLYALMVLMLSWFVASNAISEKKERMLFAALFSTAFFAVNNWCKMQAEMTCSLLLLVSLTLALKKGGRESLRRVVAGILIGLLFWFKAPLLLLSVSFAAAFMLLSKEEFKDSVKGICVVASGALASLLSIGVLVYFVNPEEYSRILMTAIYQDTLVAGNSFSFGNIKSFVLVYAKTMITVPVLYIGAACLVINFVTLMQKKKYTEGVYHFFMWMMPALYVILSNRYFSYHYLTFMLAAMTEIWIYLNQNLTVFMKERKGSLALIVLGVYLLCMFLSHAAKPLVYYKYIERILVRIGKVLLIVLFGVSILKKGKGYLWLRVISGYVFLIFFTYSALFSNNSLTYIRLQNLAYSDDFTLPVEEDEQVLYLDSGDGAYNFGYDTYYEEYYPLILQRINEGSERSQLPRYVEASKKILSYDGNYICLSEDFIFSKGKNAALKRKIETEYELYRSYNAYFPPASVFSLQTEEDMHRLDVYKRRNLER